MIEIKKPVNPWAYDEMLADYDAGGRNWFEVSSEFYWQALEVLPPIYVPFGFFVGEPQKDVREGTLYAGFTEIRGPNSEEETGNRFFARYATKSTWNAAYRELRDALTIERLRKGPEAFAPILP